MWERPAAAQQLDPCFAPGKLIGVAHKALNLREYVVAQVSQVLLQAINLSLHIPIVSGQETSLSHQLLKQVVGVFNASPLSGGVRQGWPSPVS